MENYLCLDKLHYIHTLFENKGPPLYHEFRITRKGVRCQRDGEVRGGVGVLGGGNSTKGERRENGKSDSQADGKREKLEKFLEGW